MIMTALDALAPGVSKLDLVFAGDLNYQTAMATHAIAVGEVAGKTRPHERPIFVRAEQGLAVDFGSLAGSVLFVGTPVLLIPLFTAAQARWSAQDIFLFVGAFGAMGHHLPGMIRAYGDRALFTRFKTRFIVAPVALLIVCIWSSVYNIQAVQLVAMAWGIWHGMMQTYGFGRIYDAKASARAAGAR